MRTILMAIAVVSGAAAQSGRTQEPAAVTSVVQQFVNNFNNGDAKTAAAACGKQTSIIDEFPPYEWHGADACSRWMNDFDTDAKKRAITDGVVTLGNFRHVDVAGDLAYVVVPADYAYKMNGKPVKETGSMLTLVLGKSAAGWRITGWSWSKN